METKLEDLTVIELKSIAYDLIGQLNQIQNNLSIIQKRIIELQEKEQPIAE